MRDTNLNRGVTRLIVSGLFVALLSTVGVPIFDVVAAPLAATSPSLGVAASFSVLAGTTVTNTGPTIVPGDLGVSPGSSVTGFPPGIVGPPGAIYAATTPAADAQSATTTAFNALDEPCDITYPGAKDLVGEILVSGVYCADSFELSGALTLSGAGVWIFKSASSLTTTGTANVVGGNPCNVWWRTASSATLGSNTSLMGNILASTSISLQTGASLNGRALAQTGAVTLDNNTFSNPPCAAAATPVPTATDTPVPSPTVTAIVAATATAGSLVTNTTGPSPTDILTPKPRPTHRPRATDTPGPAPTDTPGPAPTDTPIPHLVALPRTGGDPPQSSDFLLHVGLIAWVVGAAALALGLSRRERKTRQ